MKISDIRAICVPDGPGLGVRLDRDRLAQYPRCTRSSALTRTTRIRGVQDGRRSWRNDRWADPEDDRERFVQ